MHRKNELSWLVGGAQGSGVDSAANIFAKACAFGGLYVYGQREYYSNIMGEHSYYQVTVSDRPVRSTRSYTDILVSADAETVFLHARDVNPGGAIIYDPKLDRDRAQQSRGLGASRAP
jgi:2-oxoglutarate ferredoxin oxidoreductase subunit alpha